MKESKIKLYLFEVILLVILFVALIVSNNMTQSVLAFLLLMYMFLIKNTFKRKYKKSLYEREIVLLLLGFAILYVALFYLIGLIFYTFSKQTTLFGIQSLFQNIIPIAIIIITSEITRNILLIQDGSIKIRNKQIDLSKVITFTNMVLIDLIVYRGVYNLQTLNGFLGLIGFIVCASISCNLFYNYTSKKYGYKGIIIYRLITSLYVYIIPVIPNMYIYFRSFLRMTYPYIMYLILEFSYVKDKYVVPFREKRNSVLQISSILVVTALIAMLVSCQFRYGIIVIGSGSMTGTINYGDAAIFESYHGQKIKEGDIIIFKKDKLRLIHRVINIQKVNGSLRIYTQGDANDYVDEGYRSIQDVMGIYHFKISYIGYPTLFINDLFG
mgnify:FL=1